MLSASVELVLSSTASVVVVLSSTASVVVVSESPQAAKPIAITSPNATRHKTNFFIPIAPSYRLLSPTQILIKVPTSRHDNHMPVSSLHLPNTAPVRLPGRTRRSTKLCLLVVPSPCGPPRHCYLNSVGVLRILNLRALHCTSFPTPHSQEHFPPDPSSQSPKP